MTIFAASGDEPPPNFFDKLKAETVAFVSDAMNRRMGNGASFYGKRKSSFYGNDDEMKAQGKGDGDYKGAVGGGYFELDSEGRPVTRRRGTLLRKYDDEE